MKARPCAATHGSSHKVHGPGTVRDGNVFRASSSLRRFFLLFLFALILSHGDWTSGASRLKIVGANQRNKELDYWQEVREKQQAEARREKEERDIRRAEVRGTLSNLVVEGRAIQPASIELETEVATEPTKPSIFEGKRDYVLFGMLFLLAIVVTTITLIRHKREAEIRLLSGRYLADGREAARFETLSLFDSPSAPEPQAADEKVEGANENAEAAPREDPLAPFFAQVPENLAEIRKLLPALGGTDEADRIKTLLRLHDHILLLKAKANCWTLRPVWQLTSALELLVKRLADKNKDATPSAIRTVASAIDLLAELCVPGVRPDLIISPPIAVLAVDDDPLCLRAVMFALQKAEMTPDTAENGEKAVAMAAEKFYDVVFMDIKMPGIDGLEACAQIRKCKKNKNTPVVFVTVQSDFHTRAKSTLAGGTDLMAKPYLMFEITVKALMFSMRKRLELADSLRREVDSLDPTEQLQGAAILPPPVTANAPEKTCGAVSDAAPIAAPIAAPSPKPEAVINVPVVDSVTEERKNRKTSKRFKHDKEKRKVLAG